MLKYNGQGEAKASILCFKMLGARLGEAPIDLDNAEGGYCVVISISKAHSKGDTSIIYGRKIDGDESGEGQPFRLAKRDFRYIWQNKEVTDEKIRFGSVVKYAQVEDEYLFQGNTKRPRQNVEQIHMDLSYGDGGASKGIRDAFPNAQIAFKGIRQDCKPKQSLRLISLKWGVIENERIVFKTKLGEVVNLKLNCRENLSVSTSPVRLELRHVVDDDDVADVALVKMGDSECGLRKPSYQAVCEGLILKHKPKEISIDEELVEIEDANGNMFRVPGDVKFDTGNDAGTAISNKLVDALSLEPDHSKKRKLSIPGGGSLQCSSVAITIRIRRRKFKVDAIIGAVASDTDLLVGRDIMRKLGEKGFTLKLD